ncbi:DnaJ -like protein subfamily B member 12 [Sarcoptes scabiei]|nr:DnaJ -like protein subfamily B member 12 [Sarcoptes scabiei]
MEGNKDEAEKCFRIAENQLYNKSFHKALRYAQKANQLYPTDETKKLLEKCKLLAENQNCHKEENQNGSNPTNQSSDSNSSNINNNNNNNNEQQRTVDYIKNCKDYYEILGVSKSASDSEIKKQYRKLALQFHPDKNQSPGSAEAFKAIGNAFAVLSDPDKRHRYDQIGTQDFENYRRRRRGSDGFDYTRGFEEDFNAEEIFNMFFGRGFATRNTYVYRNVSPFHQGGGSYQNDPSSQATRGYTVLLQIMPILFFLCVSLLSNLVPDNPYSLTKSQKYPYQRYTQTFNVPYYVKENFERDYRDSLYQIEQHVEESYISHLQSNCFKERNYKNLIYRAKIIRDSSLEKKAQNINTPACDKLVNLQQTYNI